MPQTDPTGTGGAVFQDGNSWGLHRPPQEIRTFLASHKSPPDQRMSPELDSGAQSTTCNSSLQAVSMVDPTGNNFIYLLSIYLFFIFEII